MLKKILIGFISFNLLINTAHAGEIHKKGEVLEEDSMVFPLEEAQNMAEYISKLEKSLIKKNDILELKDELIANQDEQILRFEEYQKLQDKHIEKYAEIEKIDRERIEVLERQAKARKLETIGAFAGGVVATIGLIIIVDKLDDHVLESNITNNNLDAARATGFRVRF